MRIDKKYVNPLTTGTENNDRISIFLKEQNYTNTNSIYWYGGLSSHQGRHLTAHTFCGERVPLAWVSNSIKYAARFAPKNSKGALYFLRQTKRLNIWNALSDKDWGVLVTKYPEFSAPGTRNRLIKYDWLDFCLKVDNDYAIERPELVSRIKFLNENYDGIFNRETREEEPALGLFSRAVTALAIMDKLAWDNSLKMYISIGNATRAYRPGDTDFTFL